MSQRYRVLELVSTLEQFTSDTVKAVCGNTPSSKVLWSICNDGYINKIGKNGNSGIYAISDKGLEYLKQFDVPKKVQNTNANNNVQPQTEVGLVLEVVKETEQLKQTIYKLRDQLKVILEITDEQQISEGNSTES